MGLVITQCAGRLSHLHPDMFSLFTSNLPPDKFDADMLPLDSEVKLQLLMATNVFTFDRKMDVERLRMPLYDSNGEYWA